MAAIAYNARPNAVYTTHRLRWASVILVMLLLVAARGRGDSSAFGAGGLDDTLALASARVEAFLSRAQSLVCTETVTITPLDSGFGRRGFGRTVESDLHLSWETSDGPPADTAQVRRTVVSVNRRPPRENDPNNCTVPEQQETEPQPLAMLLPDQRGEYAFSPAGKARVDGRAAVRVDFRQLTPVSVDVETVADNEDCISYDLNGGMRGRLWFDSETMDVLRLDQHLSGMIDMRLPKEILKRRPMAESRWTLERWDSSMRFGTVHFRDPEESLVLPLSATTLRVTRGSGQPRLRTETKYANYKRFMTGGRIVGDENNSSR